jgi:hypothetical protein
MIKGFRANINQDSHRIFLSRLINHGVVFKGIQSKGSGEEYSFIFDTDDDFKKAQQIKRVMIEQYEDVPMHKSL